jgi:hypothetical protein
LYGVQRHIGGQVIVANTVNIAANHAEGQCKPDTDGEEIVLGGADNAALSMKCKRNHDVKTLKALLAQVHEGSLADHIDSVPDRINHKIFHFWEGFNGKFVSPSFHLYDDRLSLLVKRVHDAWGETLSYAHRYTDTPSGNAYIFSTQWDLRVNDTGQADREAIEVARGELNTSYRELLKVIREHYSEVDIDELSAQAWQDYVDYYREDDEEENENLEPSIPLSEKQPPTDQGPPSGVTTRMLTGSFDATSLEVTFLNSALKCLPDLAARFESSVPDIGYFSVYVGTNFTRSNHKADQAFLQKLMEYKKRKPMMPGGMPSAWYLPFSIGQYEAKTVSRGWEFFYVQNETKPGRCQDIQAWRIDPLGRFFLYRALPEDLSLPFKQVKQGATLSVGFAVWYVTDAIVTALQFFKAMEFPAEQTQVNFAFRWAGLSGRHLVWTPSADSFPTNNNCVDPAVDTEAHVPLSAQDSEIQTYVHDVVRDLFLAFQGYSPEPDYIVRAVRDMLGVLKTS